MNSFELPLSPSQALGFLTFLSFVVAKVCYDPGYAAAPVHISLILNTIAYLSITVIQCIRESYRLSQQARNQLDFLYYALFGPFALVIAILGVYWAKINKSESPYCRGSALALLWTLIMTVVHFFISRIAYEKFQILWDIYKNGPFDIVPYHPNRDFGRVQKELMREEEEEDDEVRGISVGLLEADRKQQERDIKKKQAGYMRNVTREKTCPICYVDFEIGEKVADVPNCLHTFHEECITAWFEKNITCPMCREKIVRRARKGGNHSDGQDLENGVELGV